MSEHASQDNELDFEKALAELEAVVERMENGQLPLEESLVQFERGIRLARRCQQALREAEQRVDALMEQAGAPDTHSVEPDESS